jgi:hypothetical protein
MLAGVYTFRPFSMRYIESFKALLFKYEKQRGKTPYIKMPIEVFNDSFLGVKTVFLMF